jgi:hypothetical protein
MGARSASGLEELIMGCTSTNVKEVSMKLFDPEFHEPWFVIIPTKERKDEKVNKD